MQTINRFLYGPTPEERVRQWQTKLRQEQRVLDREMRQLDTATNKARATVKQLAGKGDVKSARILAKEVVRSDKQKDRLSVSKARLGSINNQLMQQMAMIKVTGSLQKSTEIMKLSNALIKLPQISQTMREMSMEMTKVRSCLCFRLHHAEGRLCILKAGIMEEMLDDTLEMEDDEELEEEADEEVDKVLFDLTNGKLGQAGTVQTEVPVRVFPSNPCDTTDSVQSAQEQVDEEETERALEQYRQQLNGLLSG
ncbi:hypothetical protein EVJ58_g854 [Rhodofomes roseus]|uniref:Uncharacterized protein n=1 Tax=Rhodofomes roseus TaxID=34475 RepID=A0A4Y9Z271_9APHY|nr:hypothetical protein EVJ58_g854 [Rhodofomes roseus]